MLNSVPDTATLNPADAPQTLVGEAEIESLIEQAHEAQNESRPLMEPKASQKKKKVGRPPKNPADPKWKTNEAGDQAQPQGDATAPAGPPPFDATPMCKDTFKVLSRVIVAQTGVEACALQSDEIDALGATWGAVANQYMPVVLQQYGPLIAACSVTASVALRIKSSVDAEIDRRKAERAKVVPNDSKAAEKVA